MSATTAPARLAVRTLGSPPLARASRWWTRHRLRVLAYHDVPDATRFARQMEHLTRHLRPVDAATVVAAVEGGRGLPQRAVWVTFDDGHPGVLDRGAAVLERYGVRATLFVCPSAVEGTALWWQQVEAALAIGRPPADLLPADLLPADLPATGRPGGVVAALKRLPDDDRRRTVHRLAAWAADRGRDVTIAPRRITVPELRDWQAAGHSVGNHTWDHPCLDRCRPAEVADQILRADRWLATHLAPPLRLFAYPNGNVSAQAEQVLAAAGYRLAVLFDHRLAAARADPLRTSRLRVASDAELTRFRAIVSGSHASGAALVASLRARSAAHRRVPA